MLHRVVKIENMDGRFFQLFESEFDMKATLLCLAGSSLLLLGSVVSTVQAAKFNRKVDVGDAAPLWSKLKGVDGKRHSLKDYRRAKLLVVIFICNHCPATKLYQQRLQSFVKKYRKSGVRLVAVSSSLFPADGFEQMKTHAKKQGFNFDYLHDPSQTAARSYGVTHTPQVFLLDEKRKIAYMGAFDDNKDAGKVEDHYLRDAVNALLNGKRPEVGESLQFGCKLEYK